MAQYGFRVLVGSYNLEKENKQTKTKTKDNYLLQHLWSHVNITRFIGVGSEVKLNQAELKLSLTSTPAAPFRLTDGLTITQIEVRGHCQT